VTGGAKQTSEMLRELRRKEKEEEDAKKQAD
jgi:hypothetical protein